MNKRINNAKGKPSRNKHRARGKKKAVATAVRKGLQAKAQAKQAEIDRMRKHIQTYPEAVPEKRGGFFRNIFSGRGR